MYQNVSPGNTVLGNSAVFYWEWWASLFYVPERDITSTLKVTCCKLNSWAMAWAEHSEGLAFLARRAGYVGVWENMEKGFSTHSIWTHMGRWWEWNFKMLKKKKKEQDIGTDYRLYNSIWSYLPTPSLWRDIHSLINVWFLEGYTKTLLEMGMGNLNIKETFTLLCIIPFALLLWTCLF